MKTGRTLFIVDDDDDDREMLEIQLIKINSTFQVFTAIDGEDALNKLRKIIVTPDLIFLDINMPIMDGKQFLKEVQKDSKLNKIPVVIYSTSNSQKDIDDATKLGASFYLPKPDDLREMVKSLNNVLNSLFPLHC